MSAGTAQHERFPAALEEGYFHVDALSFEQQVAIAAALATQLRFVDLDNRDGGHWGALFNDDTTLVLARIAAIDLDEMHGRLSREIDAMPLASLAADITALALRMDRWFRALDCQSNPGALALRDRIRLLVEQQLAGDLQWVQLRFGQQLWQQQPIGLRPGQLSGIWRAPDAERMARLDHRRLSERDAMRDRHVAFLSAVESIQTKAREMLEASLSSGDHEPAAALLIAFLKVHQRVQQDLNRFAARHAAFYYRDCLGFQPRGPSADAALLACQRDPRALGEVSVPRGALFDAGKDALGRPLRFQAETALSVTDAVVASLCTLRLERDPSISPERDYGFITRAKATQLKPDGQTLWPTFGGSSGAGAVNARLGLAIVSPLLLLAEGEREIQVELRMRQDDPHHTGRQHTLASLMAEVETIAQTRLQLADPVRALRQAMGTLLTHWLLIDRGEASLEAWNRVRDACRDVLGDEWPQHAGPPDPGDPLSLINGTDIPNRPLLFSLMFDGVLRFSLSAANGWLMVSDAVVAPAAAGGLSVRLRLGHDAPAIVGCDPERHGEGWGTALPMLRLQLSTHGQLYACSLLDREPMSEVILQVAARGVRHLLLSNNLGRLDGTKAFMPFGPLPTLSSYFIVGSQEAAQKPIHQWTLNIEWGGLPNEPGGFDTHYQGYDRELREGRFITSVSLLRDGEWQPCQGVSAQQPLFDGLDDDGLLRERQTVEIDAGSVRQHFRATHEDWSQPTLPRNGLCRLQLNGPRGAFGHASYPLKLSEAVAANARTKRPVPLPLPPYTPLIERITADYRASSVIAANRDEDTSRLADSERLMHLLPFGTRSLQSADGQGGHGLVPRLTEDGQLYIGLRTGEASEPGGVLNLLFDMRESAVEPWIQARRSPVRWATLRRNEWRPLPASRILSDGTHGLLTSGIITVDLPRDLDRTHTIMPAGLYWLRLSTDDGFDSFARLRGVRTQGLSVRRVMSTEVRVPPAALKADAAPAAPVAPVPPEPLPPGRITKPLHTLPGVAAITQIGGSVGLGAAEDERAMYTRAGERLQHKNRASVAWDMERLLLDQFPDVFKVRCLNADHLGGVPGEVVVVVVPTVPRNRPDTLLDAPRFNALRLDEMARALKRLASPFVRIKVRNAAYERIQLRCQLTLTRGTHEGATMQRVTQRLNEALSPWHDGVYGPRFDWVIRAEELEAVLRSVPGITAVTQLSLLSVASDDRGAYALSDTARARTARDSPRQVSARTPWSLALPMPTHILSASDALADPAPQVTGISKLAIGSTFVISGGTA